MLDLEKTVLDNTLDHVKLAVDQKTQSHKVLLSVQVKVAVDHDSHCPIRISR